MTGIDRPVPDETRVRLRLTDGVALLTLADPPGNALGAPLRRALAAGLDEIADHPDIGAVVLTAEGPSFSSGGDSTDPLRTEPSQEADLAALCARIDTLPMPVVAVLQGAALGSGADLALSCHLRLAVRGARLGLPDIAIGLPPEGGATQRLPRLAGVEIALRLLLTGRPVDAATAQQVGLVDGLIDGDPLSAGLAVARRLIAEGTAPRPARARRDRLVDGVAAMEALARARAALGPHPLEAARQITDCIEAALLLPFEAGLDFEAEAHATCLAHPESRAMRALYLAERRIAPSLLVADEAGRRHPRPDGRAVIARLVAAQGRACDWLVAHDATGAAIDAVFRHRGFARGPFGSDGTMGAHDPAIWERISGALLAEGGRLIESGAVRRAGDIDALAVHGMGWPRRLGGPMIAAQSAGLAGQLRRLRLWQEEDALWSPSQPIVNAAKTAAGFPA